eukprot:TRINITY_DN2327_c0_g1_i2.p1 TRINITY_DN2327_c0_g1~~TRINITY_DN2327_c0_g1_i2.p1  ORF type:complete len:683 (+),score=89.56 TRINITY_DN2327_c0_g1_i2:348-2396(+)
MENVVLPVALPTTWYNNDTLSKYDSKFALWYNYLVGTMRLRQLRVGEGGDKQPSLCKLSKKFDAVLTTCYPPFHTKKQSTQSFGNQSAPISSAFRWQSAKDLCKSNRWCGENIYGRKKTKYPPNGFVWDFTKDATQAVAELQQLKAGRWIDAQTRAVVVEFTLYNPNIRIICAIQLLVEFFPSGTVATSDSVKPMNLLGLQSLTDIALFCGEVLLIAAVCLYIIREFQEFYTFWKVKPNRCTVCRKQQCIRNGEQKLIECPEDFCQRSFNPFRLPNCPECGREVAEIHLCWRGYFQDTWNILDIVNQFFFLLVFGLRFALRGELPKINFDVGDTFFDFYPIAWRYALANWLNSVNALLCFTKTFKFLAKFRSMSALVRTISKAKKELAGFLVIFTIVFFGFALSHNLAFGTDIDGYKDWTASLITLFLSLLGTFDYPSMLQSNRLLAPLFFITYQLMVFFILANMFIAIISMAYEVVKEEIFKGRDDFLGSSLTLYFNEWRYKIFKNKARQRLEALLVKLAAVPGLTPAQLDDIRTFRNEMEHQPSSTDLFNHITAAFGDWRTRKLTADDYTRLRQAVLSYRHVQSTKDKARFAVWDDELEMDEHKKDENSVGISTMLRSVTQAGDTSGVVSGNQPIPTAQTSSLQRLSDLEQKVDMINAMLLQLRSAVNSARSPNHHVKDL